MTRLKQYPKYGYHFDEDGLSMPDEHEQNLLCLIHDLYYNKDLSLPKVGEYLNAQGYRNRTGNEFKPNWLQRLAKQHQPHPEHWTKYKESKNQ